MNFSTILAIASIVIIAFTIGLTILIIVIMKKEGSTNGTSGQTATTTPAKKKKKGSIPWAKIVVGIIVITIVAVIIGTIVESYDMAKESRNRPASPQPVKRVEIDLIAGQWSEYHHIKTGSFQHIDTVETKSVVIEYTRTNGESFVFYYPEDVDKISDDMSFVDETGKRRLIRDIRKVRFKPAEVSDPATQVIITW